MADALISFVINQLASTALEQIKEHVGLVFDFEKEVHELEESLQTIQAVLKDAEKRQVEGASVQNWLDKLKEVLYEMDNVLDEWNAQALKQKIEELENEGENVLVNKKKVCFSIPSPSNCFCFGQDGPIVVRHAIAQDIKDLNSQLTKIVGERHTYHLQYTSVIEEPQRPKTTSSVDETEIFGRENEKSTLISMLLGDGTSTGEEERGPLVIPVVGMGGMGKTTLAQLAYNDIKVTAHFEKSIWVCVSDSDPLDQIKIAKAIISHDDTPISEELDALMQSVSKSVEGKKFILVLDDVWTEKETEWKPLKLALMSSAKGSRILVTTRKVMVARMMRATTHMIHLEKLNEQSCSSLFCHNAFYKREKDKIDLFEDIGNICNKIVQKCDGLPLAAKTLGDLMRYKNTQEEWEDVLNSEMWEIKENYLNSKTSKEKRAIGEEYFDDLVNWSFFQDFINDDYGYPQSCKMNNIVHEFIQFLANGANQETVISSDRVHHLTLMSAAEGRLSLPTPFHTCKKLHSLTIFNRRIDGDLILQSKCLRALTLRKSNVKEVPKEIGKLLHLRYIDLSRNDSLKELPDAMCNLCYLETLHLEHCGKLEKLPKAIRKLTNLKHLYVEKSGIRWLPKGLGRLTGLRILDQFECGGGDDNEILKLGDLKSFKQLQGRLEIRELGKVKDVCEAQKAQLENKEHLLKLMLHFGDNYGEQRRISDRDVLNALRPHEDLKSLSVWYYQGTTLLFGNWMMHLQHLTHLTLLGFEYCESLPPLGKLRYLEVLNIGIMKRVKKVGVELLGIEKTQTSPATPTAFAKLKHLKFWQMEGWEDWEGVGRSGKEWEDFQVTIMPCLSSLSIKWAPKLKQLPDFLQHRPLLDMPERLRH